MPQSNNSLSISCFIRSMILTIVFVLPLLFVRPSNAKLIIDLDAPSIAQIPIVVTEFVGEGTLPFSGKELSDVVRNDLSVIGLFQIVESNSVGSPLSYDDPGLDALNRLGAQALIAGKFRVSGDELTVELKLYDAALKKMEVGKRFTGKISDYRKMLHRFDDLVMEKLTGTLGCFSTKIAFVSSAEFREINVIDYDGYNLRQITKTGTINMSPDWSPDARTLLLTSYINANPDLFMLDLNTLQLFPISSRPGINASARYSPDGKFIALSMSLNKIPKIFIITPQGSIVKQLTNGRGNDISPTWSPDGSHIGYVSDQAGSPQIYICPLEGGQPRRLTFSVNYATEPDWSPNGDRLVFSAKVDGRFQICSIKTDGTNFTILTDKGSNQDPAWSPDGRMIAFSSDRSGKRLIYIMDARGSIQVPVSSVPGKAPAWSRTIGW
jgi:TolB protein